MRTEVCVCLCVCLCKEEVEVEEGMEKVGSEE